ncbi:MAG: hypothetical protein N2171_08185 [Clostridia bacterium]|nr:hypothetical protein [Clostridia bacterium]
MASYTHSSYYSQHSPQKEKKRLKKWVIQTIFSLIIFSALYAAKGCDSKFICAISDFGKYALTHNTDFYAVYQNTTNTAADIVSLLFGQNGQNTFKTTTDETAETFSNEAVESAEFNSQAASVATIAPQQKQE